MKRIILASASKRRSKILTECGIPHEVVVTGVEEKMDEDKELYNIVIDNASRKVDSLADKERNAVIIGADTLVMHDEDILGKPSGENAARKMLKKFSGQSIDVYTGLCVVDTQEDKKACGYEKSSLVVASLSDEEIEKYFKLLGPYDKAGGFSIEGVGSLIFDNIRGSYFNILGLPMMKLAGLFREVALDISSFIKK